MSDYASKTKGLVWVVSACILGMVLAVGLAPLAHIIPWSWEKKLAYVVGSDVPRQECHSSLQAHALLKQLVKRIYPVNPDDADFSINVQIAKDPVVNAYAQLGGDITVNSGLLERTESPEEIAGVLAHEIEHVHHRHIMQGAITHMLTAEGMSIIFSGSSSSTADWARFFLNMSFTSAQEAQADEGGLLRLQKAHVDNQGFRRFFERMDKEETVPVFLSDHPSNHSRIEMAERFENRDIRPIMTRQEWKILKDYCTDR